MTRWLLLILVVLVEGVLVLVGELLQVGLAADVIEGAQDHLL